MYAWIINFQFIFLLPKFSCYLDGITFPFVILKKRKSPVQKWREGERVTYNITPRVPFLQEGTLEWPFWTKLIVVAIGFTGGLVFMYVQCKMYVQLCKRWRAFNRVIYVQNAPEKVWRSLCFRCCLLFPGNVAPMRTAFMTQRKFSTGLKRPLRPSKASCLYWTTSLYISGCFFQEDIAWYRFLWVSGTEQICSGRRDSSVAAEVEAAEARTFAASRKSQKSHSWVCLSSRGRLATTERPPLPWLFPPHLSALLPLSQPPLLSPTQSPPPLPPPPLRVLQGQCGRTWRRCSPHRWLASQVSPKPLSRVRLLMNFFLLLWLIFSCNAIKISFSAYISITACIFPLHRLRWFS